MLQAAIEFCLDFLFPKRCAVCSREGSMLCEGCRPAIPTVSAVCFVCERRSPEGEICEGCRPETRLRRFIAPLAYSEPAARDLIHALKYAGMRHLAQDLAGWIVNYVRAVKVELPPASVFAPIPLHRRKLRERGFNQAELLAEKLAAAFGIPARTDILSRTKYATPQSKIKRREERLKNATGLYAVKNALPEKTTVILVDDVSTTGATLEEAARVLKEAGAKQVWAFTAAR